MEPLLKRGAFAAVRAVSRRESVKRRGWPGDGTDKSGDALMPQFHELVKGSLCLINVGYGMKIGCVRGHSAKQNNADYQGSLALVD